MKDGVNVHDGVGVPIGVSVAVPVGVSVEVGVKDGVNVHDGVGVPVSVCVGVSVAVSDEVAVGVADEVDVAESVGVMEAVFDGTGLGVQVDVAAAGDGEGDGAEGLDDFLQETAHRKTQASVNTTPAGRIILARILSSSPNKGRPGQDVPRLWDYTTGQARRLGTGQSRVSRISTASRTARGQTVVKSPFSTASFMPSGVDRSQPSISLQDTLPRRSRKSCMK